MSGRVVSDIQTQAGSERLYVRYNTDANIVIEIILVEKIERKVYVNQ